MFTVQAVHYKGCKVSPPAAVTNHHSETYISEENHRHILINIQHSNTNITYYKCYFSRGSTYFLFPFIGNSLLHFPIHMKPDSVQK